MPRAIKVWSGLQCTYGYTKPRKIQSSLCRRSEGPILERRSRSGSSLIKGPRVRYARDFVVGVRLNFEFIDERAARAVATVVVSDAPPQRQIFQSGSHQPWEKSLFKDAHLFSTCVLVYVGGTASLPPSAVFAFFPFFHPSRICGFAYLQSRAEQK